MTTLILKRLGIGLVTVLAVSLIIFFGTKILPGDAAQIRLGQSATPENVAAFRHSTKMLSVTLNSHNVQYTIT